MGWTCDNSECISSESGVEGLGDTECPPLSKILRAVLRVNSANPHLPPLPASFAGSSVFEAWKEAKPILDLFG